MRAHLFKLFGFIFFVLSGLFVIPVSAQIKSAGDTTSLESLLERARKLAYNKEEKEARKICINILSRDSTYLDAAVLLAKTYSWSDKHDSAKLVLMRIIENKPGHYDAIEAMIDNESANQNFKEALKYADMGLKYYPDNESFLLKKNLAAQNIKQLGRVNRIAINYWADFFDENTPWNFASVTISRKTKHFGMLALRYNYANRFGNNGNQFEIDAYPVVSKNIYIYFNAGISNKKNFPTSRISIEPYFKLPKGFELSAGIRYMNFDVNRTFSLDSNKVFIYTGTIGKYIDNYWISLRPYFTRGNKAWSSSAILTARRYFSDADSYISLNLGTGMSPDEQQYAFDPGLKYLKANKISLEYQQKIVHRFIFNCGAGYAKEEIRTGVKRNRYSMSIGMAILF
ncbi:MAG: YaiO family outer membrane beta-barrel protein [Bacteroidales bacterium]|nr:YaiO family outer membrane beta-barrel protein [Bacteroidales bacterium]